MLFFERQDGVTENLLAKASACEEDNITDKPVKELYIDASYTKPEDVSKKSEIIKKFSEEGGEYIRVMCFKNDGGAAALDLLAYAKTLGLVTSFETAGCSDIADKLGQLTNKVILNLGIPKELILIKDLCNVWSMVVFTVYACKFKGNIYVNLHMNAETSINAVNAYRYIITTLPKIKAVWFIDTNQYQKQEYSDYFIETLREVVAVEKDLTVTKPKFAAEAMEEYEIAKVTGTCNIKTCIHDQAIAINKDMKVLPCYNYLWWLPQSNHDSYNTYKPEYSIRKQRPASCLEYCNRCCTYYENADNAPGVLTEIRAINDDITI